MNSGIELSLSKKLAQSKSNELTMFCPTAFFQFWIGCATISFAAVMISISEYAFRYTLLFLPLCVFSYVCLVKTKCTYIFDFNNGQLDFKRQFFFLRNQYTVCPFSEIEAVTVSGDLYIGRGYETWKYTVMVITQDGQSFAVSDEFSLFDNASKVAEELAVLMNTDFITGMEERSIKVTKDSTSGETSLSFEIDPRKSDFPPIIIGFAVSVLMTIFGVMCLGPY